jgi:protein-tyrosine phosphatase
MIDLHCHILPHVDDGPQSLDESLRMARFYVQDGIRYVVATPHCHRYIHLLRADIVPRVAELNEQFLQADIPLTVLPGSEIQVTDSMEYRREFEAGLYCHLGDGKNFTLLEFNWAQEQLPPDVVELIAWIRDQGMTPIVAHPERYDFFAREPALLKAMVDAGAWVQITVDSLLGNHGPAPQVLGEELLRIYADAVLATDAHNMTRCSGLSAGFARVREHFGQERADALLSRADQVQQAILQTDS